MSDSNQDNTTDSEVLSETESDLGPQPEALSILLHQSNILPRGRQQPPSLSLEAILQWLHLGKLYINFKFSLSYSNRLTRKKPTVTKKK